MAANGKSLVIPNIDVAAKTVPDRPCRTWASVSTSLPAWTERLLRQGKLKLGGSVEFLKDVSQRDNGSTLEQTDWNVFIQGPPEGKSDPAQVVKYLAGYLTGGPIADSRLIRAR